MPKFASISGRSPTARDIQNRSTVKKNFGGPSKNAKFRGGPTPPRYTMSPGKKARRGG